MHGANAGNPDVPLPPTLRAWEDFYAHASLPRPILEPVEGQSIPEPYRRLLVHNGDMTPALESFHAGAIHLEVLRSKLDGNRYERDVVLRMNGSHKPVEFGAIEIDLSVVGAAARKEILEAHKPLGAILRDFAIAHLSRPKAFVRLQSDPIINASLQLAGPLTLYGRRNTLLLPDGRTLAEIVEILPP